jgi:hypothetical protein
MKYEACSSVECAPIEYVSGSARESDAKNVTDPECEKVT